MRYITKNQRTEEYCKPFVMKWLADIIGDRYYIPISIPNYDPSLKGDTNNDIYKFLQAGHVDIIVDYGARKPAYIDFKGTYGLGNFEGYYKLTMELYFRESWEGQEIYHESYPFLTNKFPANTQYLLYASKEIMVLIPKEQLNKVILSDRYKSKFDVSNIEWKLNKSDNNKGKYVKNIYFSLLNKYDLEILEMANTHFYRLIEGKYAKISSADLIIYLKEVQNNR